MEAIFRNLKRRWHALNAKRKGAYYGIVIDNPADPLTNLRFADDVLIVAQGSSDIRKMISDLDREAAKFGLKLHAGKTKILTNSRTAPETLLCSSLAVEVVRADSPQKYLGRMLSIYDLHQTEISSRMACAWRAFFKFKQALCSPRLSLRDRVRLFECVVSPCALYACAMWTLTSELAHTVRVTRRRMDSSDPTASRRNGG